MDIKVLPVLPVQRDMLLDLAAQPYPGKYHIAVQCELPKEHSLKQLVNSIENLVAFTATFHLSFHHVKDQFIQIYNRQKSFKLEQVSTTQLALSEWAMDWIIYPFDLHRDCLFRAAYVKAGDKQYLFIVLHHLVGDLTTVGLILNKIESLYLDKDRVEEYTFEQYTQWISSRIYNSESNQQNAEFWQERLHKVEGKGLQYGSELGQQIGRAHV